MGVLLLPGRDREACGPWEGSVLSEELKFFGVEDFRGMQILPVQRGAEESLPGEGLSGG